VCLSTNESVILGNGNGNGNGNGSGKRVHKRNRNEQAQPKTVCHSLTHSLTDVTDCISIVTTLQCTHSRRRMSMSSHVTHSLTH